jgi:hypothetical protein
MRKVIAQKKKRQEKKEKKITTFQSFRNFSYPTLDDYA